MKKIILIPVQSLLLLFFICSYSIASPNVVIDGNFSESEWTSNDLSTTNFRSVAETPIAGYTQPTNTGSWTSTPSQFFADGRSVIGPGGGGEPYNVNYLGLFVDSKYLYFGLQTGFDIKDGNSSYKPGDFAIDFSRNGEPKDWEFGIKNHLDSYTSHLHVSEVSAWNYGPVGDLSPFSIGTSVNLGGKVTDDDSGDDFEFKEGYIAGVNQKQYTLEGRINLALLADKLSYLEADANGNVSFGDNAFEVSLLWTMGCGNDYIKKTISYTPGSPVPEPATLLLFGMGLIGMSAINRKKAKK